MPAGVVAAEGIVVAVAVGVGGRGGAGDGDGGVVAGEVALGWVVPAAGGADEGGGGVGPAALVAEVGLGAGAGSDIAVRVEGLGSGKAGPGRGEQAGDVVVLVGERGGRGGAGADGEELPAGVAAEGLSAVAGGGGVGAVVGEGVGAGGGEAAECVVGMSTSRLPVADASAGSVPGVTTRCVRSVLGNSRTSPATTARSAQSRRGFGLLRRSTANLVA